jgi:cell pole-organizing protein PopZ
MAASAEASAFRPIEAESDVMFEEPLPEPAMERRSSLTREERDLMSRATSDAVNSAFNSLAQTVLVQNARTLEDLVKEMLRPMLKSWLDDNLPGLVERLVRAEIERVSRGR